MEEDDEQFRGGQLLGRMQTLREIMDRLDRGKVKTIDPADPLAIFDDIEARHHDLHRWLMQAVQECEAEMELFRHEQED